MAVTVSMGKTITTGIVMCILCAVLLIVYITYFNDPVYYTKNYVPDLCTIMSIQSTSTSYACTADGSSFIGLIEMPCVKIFVNSSKLGNITFYRSIEEKIFIRTQNIDCSFTPNSCDQDTTYLGIILANSITELFPPPGIEFDCFVQNNSLFGDGLYDVYGNPVNSMDTDSLFFIPDVYAYYTSIGIISFGCFLSVCLIMYGLLVTIFSNFDLVGIKSGLSSKSKDDQNLINYVKKVLDEAHVDPDEIHNNNLEILMNSVPNAHYMDLSYEDLRKRTRFDHLIQKANKFRMGDNEYNIGRISYSEPRASVNHAHI